MAFVKLINTGQTFFVEPHESILEAAIRAGVPLDYGCSSGNCGLCKAKVVHGSVQLHKPYEHVLSEAEKLQGYALMCAHTCLEDIEIYTDAIVGNQDIPRQTIDVKVKRLCELEEDVISLTVQTPRTRRLRFAAGQYVELTSHGHRQPVSIASCPCDDRLLDFHFRMLADNPFVTEVLSRLRPGSSLTLEGPYGRPAFDQPTPQRYFLLAFDTGFGAVKSVIEHLFSKEQEARMHLLWVSCQSQSYLHNLCRSWVNAFDQFSYATLVIEERVRLLCANQVQTHIAEQLRLTLNDFNLSDWNTYAVLPQSLLEPVGSLLRSAGDKNMQIQLEPIRGDLYARCL